MLLSPSPDDWFERAGLAEPKKLVHILSDQLHSERKAAENALSLVRRYPHDAEFVEALSRLAHEETAHVVQVAALMEAHGLTPQSDIPNPYTRALFCEARSTEPDRRIDLLICAGYIEARSHERLRLMAEGFARTARPALADFYTVLANAEERHAETFIDLARPYASPSEIKARLATFGALEAQVINTIKPGPRVH